MEDLNELYKLLERADAAGDEESVITLIPYIKQVEAAVASQSIEEPTEEQPVTATQPDLTQAPKVIPQQKPEDVGFLARAKESLKEGITSFGGIKRGYELGSAKERGDLATAATKMQEIKTRAEQPVTPTLTATDINRIAHEKGLLPAGAQVPSYIVEQVLKSGPEMAVPILTSLLVGTGTAMVSGPFAPVAAPIAATVAGIGSYGLQQYGHFMETQGLVKKAPEDLDPNQARVWAAITAPLGFIVDKFVAGVGSKFGQKAMLSKITEEIAKRKAAGEGVKTAIAKEVGKAAGVGAAKGISEMPTEMFEQAAEIIQAGGDITTEESKRQLFEAGWAGLAVGSSVGSAANAYSKYKEFKTEQQQQQQEAEPPPTTEKRPSRETLKRQFIKSAEEEANEINKVKAEEAAKLKAAQNQQVISEAADLESMAPVNPTALTEATLTSWGIKKNSNAFKALKGVDASTPEGRDLVDKTLEAYTGKLNEDAINTFTSLLDQQKAEAPDARINLGTTTISDEVLGGQKYGTPGGTQGRYGPTTDISGSVAGIDQTRTTGVNAPLVEEAKPLETIKGPEARAKAPTLKGGERLLSIQELLNDPNPQQRRAARRSFMDWFKTQETNELIKEGAKLEREERAKFANLKKTQYPIVDQSTNLANILSTLKDKPNYLIEDLKNPDVPDAERQELNQHARDYLLAESLRNKYKVRMTPEEVAALEKEGETITRKEKPLSEDEFKDLQEEYLARQTREEGPLEAREPSDIRNDALNLRNKVPENVHPEIWDKYLKQKKWELAEPYTMQEKAEMTKSWKRFSNAVNTYAPGQDAVAVATKLNEEFNKLQPQEARSKIQETGETPESIEGAFQKQYGKNVRLAKQRGLLNFLKDASELPPEIGKVSPTTKAVYHKGKGYFITNRITKEDAPRMLLHEIGVHYGLEGMLGTANYKRVVKQIKQKHLTDKELKAAWDNTIETYPEYAEGSDNFMQEVIANIGETAPNNTIWRQIVGYIKQFLSKLGYGWDVNKITVDDIRDMVQQSVRMSLAGKIKQSSTGVALSSEETGAPKPTYYSLLARTITNATFPRGVTTQPAAQWLTWLNSKMSEGIKKDELEFSGITDYLKMRGNNKVDKQELLTYLENNGPQIKEIKLGVDEEGRYDDQETRDAWVEEHLQDWIEYNYGEDPEQKLWENARDNAIDNYDFPYYVKEENITDADGNKGYRVYSEHWKNTPADENYYFSESEAQAVADDENNNGIESFAEEVYRELKRDYERALEHQREELEADFEHYHSDTTDTKYNSVTLAGGNNKYAEIILQLLPRENTKTYTVNKIDVSEIGDNKWIWSDDVTAVVLDRTEYNSKEEAEAAGKKAIGTTYDLPSGETEPVKFTHFHWEGVANPVAHYRVNQRMDKTGARVLFVEEIQSDWAQMPKTLRKRYIRKLANQYGIKPEKIAAFVPGDWGFKRELTEDQQKQLDLLETEIKSIDEQRKANKIEMRDAFKNKNKAFDQIAEIVKQLGKTSLGHGGVLIAAEYITRPGRYKYKIAHDEVSSPVREIVDLLIDNGHVQELVATFNKYSAEESAAESKVSTIAKKYLDLLDQKAAIKGTSEGDKIERGPWVQDTEAWSNLILKNIVRFAVDQGYEKVAFVNGLQAAYKGGRLEQFEEVFVTRNQSDMYDIHAILKDSGGETRTIPNVLDEALEEYVGNIADQVRELQPGETDGWDADKIQLASKGMKEFYDVYIPRYMGKLLKKLGGGNLETISFEAPNAYAPPEQRVGDQVGFTITPEMANKALQGQTLFARASKQQLDEDLKKSNTVGKADKGFPTLGERFVKAPIQTIDEIVADLRKSLFSFDAAQNNKMIRIARQNKLPETEIAKMIQASRVSQAVKADQIADMWMVHGGIEYDPESFSFVIKDLTNSMSTIRDTLKTLAKKYKVSEYEMYQYGHAAFVSSRSADLIKQNQKLYKRIVALYASGKTAAAKKAAEGYKLVNQTPAEIKRGLKFFDSIPELKKLKKVWNINRSRLMDVAVENGLYTREQAEELLDVIDYVPFFRDKQVEAGKALKEYPRGLLDVATQKHLKGSYQPVHNVFDNMERWARYTLKKSINNKAAQEKIKYYSKIVPDDIKILKAGRSVTGNTVGVWQEGKVVKYEFQGYDGESMVDGFTGMEPATMAPGAAFTRPFNEFLRAQIVLEPLFNLAQIPMDMFNAMFSSGVNVSIAVPLQVVKEIVFTPLGISSARKYLTARGITGKRDFNSEYDRIDINGMKEVKELSKTGKLIEYILAPPKALLKGARFLGMVSDNIIRQAVYSQVLLETGDKARATYAADEIINFRRTGSSSAVNLVRQNAVFINANLQAMNISYGTIMLSDITNDRKLIQLRRLLLNGAQVIMAGLALVAINADDDDYKKTDPKDRDNAIMLPGTGGYKLPLRGDILTFIFKVLPEHLYNRYIEESEDSEKMKKALSVAFQRALTMPSPIPSYLTFFIEQGLNFDFVTGRPLKGRSQEDLEADLQYSNKYTSQFARAVTDLTKDKWYEVTPIGVQHFMNRWLASTSMLVGLFTNSIIANMRGEILPTQTIREKLLQIPNMGRFLSKEENTRNINDFYELSQLIDAAVQSANRYKSFDMDKYKEFLAKDNKAALINLRKELAIIKRDLSNIREYENRIYASKDTGKWTPQTKKDELMRLEALRQKILGHEQQVKDGTDRYIQNMRKAGGL